MQLFNLNIRYKKGSTNHDINYLSQHLIVALNIVLNSSKNYTSGWLQLYKNDLEFVATYKMLMTGKPFLEFHLQDGMVCYLGHLCIPSSVHEKLIWEVHYSRVTGNFGAEKIVALLYRYVY